MYNILVKRTDDGNVRVYEPNFKVSASGGKFKWAIMLEDGAALKRVGRKGAALVKRILRIKGISELEISPYEIVIKKGGNFLWKDVERQVVEEILKSAPKVKTNT